MDKCGFCDGLDVTEDCYKVVCLSCGTILDDVLLDGALHAGSMALSTKRFLSIASIDMQCDENTSLSCAAAGETTTDFSGGTIIRAVTSAPMSSSCFSTPMMRRVQEKHLWSQTSHKERAVFKLLNEIMCNMASSNTMVQGSVVEDAKRIYLESNSHNIRGNKSAKLAACVYLSMQKNGTPKPCKEVADMFGACQRDVARTIKKITNHTASSCSSSSSSFSSCSSAASGEHMKVSQLLNKTCSVLGIDTLPSHHHVINMMHASAKFNCTPSTLVGACLCFCHRDNTLLHESIAGFLDISMSTIAKYMKIVQSLDTLVVVY